MQQVEHINPRLLTWARETAGFTVPEAAPKLGLKDGVNGTAAEKLIAIEKTGRISRSVLQKAAAVFRRPLIAFYLPDVPRRGDRGEDFRGPAAIGSPVSPREEGMLDALVRDVRTRQQIVREILDDEEEAVELPVVASIPPSSSPQAVANAIRLAVRFPLDAQERCRTPEHLFNQLRLAAERAGVYVLVLGDLGSPQSDISEQVFRGFAIADSFAPFVVVNDNDAAAGRSFTLLHELAHILIGSSGVSGPLRRTSQNPIELLCNDAASYFLLPPDAFAAIAQEIRIDDPSEADRLSASIAQKWNVSQGVVVYRLVRTGWISDEIASTLFAGFSERWRQFKERQRQERDPNSTSPGYYQLRRSMVGARLLDVTRRAFRGGTITRTTAAKVLGVRPTSVEAMLTEPKRVRKA